MRKSVRMPPHRPGLATLEFVLVWPLLLMLAAGLFLMARATIAKEAAATRARNDVWSARTGANSGGTFRAVTEPAASTAVGQQQVTVVAGSLFKDYEFLADSRGYVVANEWDARDPDARFNKVGLFQPHVGVIGRLLAGGGWAEPGGLSALLAGGLRPGNVGGIPVSDALGQINKIKHLSNIAVGGLRVCSRGR